MNKKKDEAMNVKNVRLLSAVYFGLLALIGTVIIDLILYSLGVDEIIPIFSSMILSALLAAIFGALFANKIVHSKRPYKLRSFGWGTLIVILSLPIYVLALLIIMSYHHAAVFAETTLMQYVSLYFVYLVFTSILAGFWLAILSGFAAMYLRGRLVYDMLHTEHNKRKLPVEKQTKHHRKSTPHRVRHGH